MRITTNYMLLASVLTAGALATACSEEKFQETPDRDEIYAREFIKEFGAPDPDHDWTMATTAGLRVNAPDPVSLQVYAEIDGQLYIFADIPGYKGENAVPVTIPKGTEELIVVADGKEYRCSPSATLDLSTAQPARGSRNLLKSATTISSFNKNRGSRSSIDTQATTEDDEYAIIKFEDNPEILKILKDPFNSEYLCKYSDTGAYLLGTPFMSNVSVIYRPWGTAKEREILHIYHNSPIACYIGVRAEDDFKPNDNTQSTLIHSNDVCYSNNGTEWNKGRAPLNTDISIKTRCIDISELANDHSFYYEMKPAGGGFKSLSYSRFNYKEWGNRFFNAKIRDMNQCYCSAVFFHNVPIKWTHHGEVETTIVQLWGLYKAPQGNAFPRPSKPDSYLIEWHGVGDSIWEFVLYDKKDAQPYKWRLFAEDLGGSHDWDFNDLVIEYSDLLTRYEPEIDKETLVWSEEEQSYIDPETFIKNECGYAYILKVYSQLFPQFPTQKLNDDMMVRKITVTPLAAGGTLPIYFAFHGKLSGKHPVDPDMLLSDYMNNHQSPVYHEGDFVIGCEMHKWLGGSSHHTPLNVGETKTHSGKEVTFYTTADLPNPNDWNCTLNTLNLNNFRVLVDPDNTLGASLGDAIDGNADIKSVDINAWNGGYVVNKPSLTDESKTPQVLIANITSPWAKEGKNFGEAYPYFGDWIRDPNSVPLWTVRPRVEELLVKE